MAQTIALGRIISYSVFYFHEDTIIFRFHELRHTCASLLLKNGVSMKEIQEWLGHSNFSTTENTYAHLDTAAKGSSAVKLTGALPIQASVQTSI